MQTSQLGISYSGPAAAAPLDLLLIEQEEWSGSTGQVSRVEMVRYLAALFSGEEYQSSVDCGMEGGSVVCLVYVFPLLEDLVYQFHASHGSLSQRSVALLVEEEELNFTLTIEASPSHPPREILSVEWLDECYDSQGTVVDPPDLTIDGLQITIPSPVYGSALVRYRTERHAYLLHAPRRDDAIDNHYSAAVWGVYDGGINWLEIEMPPGIETFELDAEADCGWGGSGILLNPDNDPYPVADTTHTRITDVDYCGQEIIKEEIY